MVKHLFRPFLAAVIAASMVLAGCASFGIGKETANTQIRITLEQGTIRGGVVAGIEAVAKKNPQAAVELASDARETMDAVDAFLMDPKNAQASYQDLHDFVTQQIAAQHFNPLTIATVETVRDLVSITLQDAMQNKDLSTVLTPQVISGLKLSMSSIRDGLTLSGY